MNLLKLNDSKMEFLEFHPSSAATVKSESSFSIGNDVIAPTHTTKNLGVVLDDCFLMSEHITATCRSVNFQLFRLSRIRRYLSPDALKMAVHSLIASKLDYCKAYLWDFQRPRSTNFNIL